MDEVWRTALHAPAGPFQIMDVVGLRTVYAIHSHREGADDEANQRFLDIVKNEYLDKGKTGKESGSAFYDYDENGEIKA